jgi:hypothetical protein
MLGAVDVQQGIENTFHDFLQNEMVGVGSTYSVIKIDKNPKNEVNVMELNPSACTWKPKCHSGPVSSTG